ncbi:MAG: phosphatidylserine decarboxylase family protein [Desulfobacteraceae bacterium]|nr:MAG: phosphatidylserine decarboxylase family protein [Desulfobacteraceae bacterium]
MEISSEATRKRINNRLKIAREGLPFIGIGIVLSLVFAALDLETAAVILGALTLFTIYFFRDPERRSEHSEKTVLAPADGRILGVYGLESGNSVLGEAGNKVSIFMSVFNVHVNRIPASGKISEISYFPGRFFSANLDKASAQNENNRVTLETGGKRIVFVQIAGLIARRIACWIREGDEVRAGQRFGLIRFGSRLDIYLPQDIRVVAQKGQKVKAGETILGYLP